MKLEIFEPKIHYPKAGSNISDECQKMFTRVNPWNTELMMFNDTLIIMVHKQDVMTLDILGVEFGILKKPSLVPKESRTEVKE